MFGVQVMLNVIRDGLFVFHENIWVVTAFFVTVVGIGYYSIGFVTNRQLDIKIKLLASFGVGCILLSLISFIFIIMSHLWDIPLQIGGYATLLFAIYALLKSFLSGEFKYIYNHGVFIMLIALFILFLMRLAFLRDILLPPYSDSPIHYQVMLGFLNPGAEHAAKLSLGTIFSNYYHFGFHSLAAWLASITELDPAKTISIIGQSSLLIAPVSIMFLFYILTQNSYGALFAGLLASVGWLMPSFSVNWGKFPALMSMAIIPVAASLPLLLNTKLEKMRALIYASVLLIGITFIHTRIAICLIFAYLGFYIVYKLQINKEFGFFQSARYTLLFVLFVWPLSHLVIDFYNNIPILIILLVLMPFAFQIYPAVSTGVLIFLSGLSLAALIPNLFDIGGRTLLDRQFLAMILYIPFSVMGGLGFAGFIKKVSSNVVVKNIVTLFLFAGVFANASSQSFYPDHCCNYYKENDALAFQWIKENSSSRTLYYIPTINSDDKAFGSDAGMWISPLTEISTNKMPFNTDWNSENAFDAVCPPALGDVYIYAGGKRSSFNDDQLTSLAWASPVFRAGEVAIYKVAACTFNK